ncbi:SMI1/KNR4 family protein [Clostridium aciditolerans]|uniref:SMI1/KNR4 family protein n=1 Tax=Clostridium aciditolerans TaxID=339861 RepID=A0A934HSD0_9CLOT|nr:SMI1/KNR4 family protein [Clostridium aciditolerans]MBI6873440.1 SMI1/KNR4 family protein [Clostridium aciditolerans]
MNKEVLEQAQNLIMRVSMLDTKNIGRVATLDEIKSLQKDLDNRVPAWYIELISTIPLINLEFGFQEFEPEEGFDGISYLTWAEPDTIKEECIDAVPGCAVFDKGYICIASCSHSSGDPFFISIDEGYNPPVYRMDHNYGEDTEDILMMGKYKIAESLSNLFKNAFIE